MNRKRWVLAIGAVAALAVAPQASASPYGERCGDGTPHGCVQHCMVYHGGLRNLDECLYYHWLV